MKYNKKQIEQKRLKRLHERLGGNYTYPSGVELKEGRYIRYYGRADGVLSFMKRHNNKRLRHFDGELFDGSYYRRIFEHWWNIYWFRT